MATTDNMTRTWNSITLPGNLGRLSPALHKFRWQIQEQVRTRDDSPQGMRLSENLLFEQLGYSIYAINRRI